MDFIHARCARVRLFFFHVVLLAAIAGLSGCASYGKRDESSASGSSGAAGKTWSSDMDSPAVPLADRASSAGSSAGSSGSGGISRSSLIDARQSSVQVSVYFATDRQFVGSPHYFDGAPNTRSQPVSYGNVLISLPSDRAIGEIPQRKWYEFSSSTDPARYVVLKAVSRLEQGRFFSEIRQLLHDDGERQAFVYIHGFNNSFEDAAKRTAQIAADINLPSLPIFYSWPSRGGPEDYPSDEESAAWTQSHLEQFLADFADQSSADSIYIIAHSLGNRPTINALANLLEKRPDLKPRFKQLILAAPDVNAAIFRSDIAPRFRQLSTPVTVYASRNDKALQASRRFHRWPRLGDMNDDALGIDGIDLVDASAIATDFMGHDYTLSNRALLTDIQTIMRDGTRASRRSGLRGVPDGSPRYYAFP